MYDENLPEILRDTILALVQQPGPDLTARQLAALLVCYLEDGPHTVRGLAKRMGVPKPAITRALDRLEQFDLTERRPDPSDRRSILIARTAGGHAYMEALEVGMDAAAA